ncbi:MAG: HAMP domain-containing protein [Ardenticatenaceae bacterium]|nr:HAMP domain-containing protein [Ardenticatenaceae bacterium]
MLRSLVSRFAFLFAGYLLLVVLSGLLMLHLTEAQRRDALTINLAGRQRVLVQTLVRGALVQAQEPTEANRRSLAEALTAFDATLTALRFGGRAPYLPGSTVEVAPPSNPETIARLDEVIRQWAGFRPHVENLLAAQPGEESFTRAMAELGARSDALLDAADAAVRSFERVATERVERLRRLQEAFVLLALGLLVGGSWWTYRSVVRPLRRLEEMAHRIGHGDLVSPVPALGVGEIGRLAGSLEAMRIQLRATHADLEAQVRARTQELEAVNEIAQDLVSRLEVEQILDSVVKKARSLLGGEVAALCLLDQPSAALHLAAVSGASWAAIGDQMPAGQGLSQGVVHCQPAVSHCPACSEECCPLLAVPFAHNHLAVPVCVEGQLQGALCLAAAESQHVRPDGTLLLRKLADAAAVALNNARLYRQAEGVGALEERERIAAEMHDGLAQTLSYLHLQVDQALEELAEGADAGDRLVRVRDTLERAIEDARATIDTLHSPLVPPRPLSELVRRAVGQATRGTSLDGTVQMEVVEDWVVRPETAGQVQRIVQEAVTNASHHGRAHRVIIRLYQEGDEGVVFLEDDGIGFDPSRRPSNGRPHFGLSIMQARATRIGGHLSIQSAPGRGTRIALRWPLKGSAS